LSAPDSFQERLRGLDMLQLRGLFDAHMAASDVFSAEANTPRAWDEKLEALLNTEMERHHAAAEAVIEEVGNRRPSDPAEAGRRASILAAWHANAEEWDRVAALAAEGLLSHEAVMERARRWRGQP
jgi:hypothetical protein